MQGEQSNEEKLTLEQKIKDLTGDLDAKCTTHTLLSLQIKRLQVRNIFDFFNATWLERKYLPKVNRIKKI